MQLPKPGANSSCISHKAFHNLSPKQGVLVSYQLPTRGCILSPGALTSTKAVPSQERQKMEPLQPSSLTNSLLRSLTRCSKACTVTYLLLTASIPFKHSSSHPHFRTVTEQLQSAPFIKQEVTVALLSQWLCSDALGTSAQWKSPLATPDTKNRNTVTLKSCTCLCFK